MKKNKFVLTNDIVKVEPEPDRPVEKALKVVEIERTLPPLKEVYHRVQMNLKIDRDIKAGFQIWCFRNKVSMSDKLEEVLKSIMSEG